MSEKEFVCKDCGECNTKGNNIEIQINKEVVNYVQSLDYEANSRRDIIAFMLQSNMNTDTDAFKKYQKEQYQYFAEFNVAKLELQKFFPEEIKNKKLSWELSYDTGILTIHLLKE